jgi:hypothetical protein
MPIIASEIQYRLSGGASNSNPDASLGGIKSSTAWTTTLFDDVPSAEATAGSVEYRCFYVHNANATLTLIAPKVWIASNTTSATTTVAIGLGSSVQGGTEQTVVNETTAPSAVTFAEPADFASGITLGDIPAGGHRAIWIRRTVSAGTAAIADSFTIRVQGDTNP